ERRIKASLDVLAQALGSSGSAIPNRQRDEPTERLDRRCPRSRLPLVPLLGNPPPRPLVDGHVAWRWRPVDGLASRCVEPLAPVVGEQDLRPESVGQGASAERPAEGLAVDDPPDDPTLVVAHVLATVLDRPDTHVLRTPTHHTVPKGRGRNTGG